MARRPASRPPARSGCHLLEPGAGVSTMKRQAHHRHRQHHGLRREDHLDAEAPRATDHAADGRRAATAEARGHRRQHQRQRERVSTSVLPREELRRQQPCQPRSPGRPAAMASLRAGGERQGRELPPLAIAAKSPPGAAARNRPEISAAVSGELGSSRSARLPCIGPAHHRRRVADSVVPPTPGHPVAATASRSGVGAVDDARSTEPASPRRAPAAP